MTTESVNGKSCLVPSPRNIATIDVPFAIALSAMLWGEGTGWGNLVFQIETGIGKMGLAPRRCLIVRKRTGLAGW
jgi:hypothetical protein